MVLLWFVIANLTIASVSGFEPTGTSPNGFNEYSLHRLSQDMEKFFHTKFISTVIQRMGKKGLLRQIMYTDLLQFLQRFISYDLLDVERDRALGKEFNKYQSIIPEDVAFPCNTTGGRSKERPTSVNRLRPGDIDLVVNVGDSLTRGTGIMASNIFQFWSSDHDVSMTIGGRGTWREYLTLPNILKEFNPNLIGYATAPAINFPRTDNSLDYNFAQPLASSTDLMVMAKDYIRKLKKDTRVDIQNDWKLLSLLMGANDMCTFMCHADGDPFEEQRKDLEQFLDFIMTNSPRTIVNLILVPNVIRIFQSQTDLSPICQITTRIVCHCYFFHQYSQREQYMNQMDELSFIQMEMANKPKYQEKEDFAVVAQPILLEVKFPTKYTVKGETTDYTYFAPDCSHISQKANAAVANGLWNSLLTPPDRKKHRLNHNLYETFLCPTAERPFIATLQN